MKTEIVRKLWQLYERRDWTEAEKLFAPDAEMTWHTSGERFSGASAIIEVNRIYPEGWAIEVLETTELTDGRVLSVVKVSHPPNLFFAVSFFTVEDYKIQKIDEFWATFENPPDWRNPENIKGYQRL